MAKCKPNICYVVLINEKSLVKNGGFIVIPGGEFHYIGNLNSGEEFKIITFWPPQKKNEPFFIRHKAWAVKNPYDSYTENVRMQHKWGNRSS